MDFQFKIQPQNIGKFADYKEIFRFSSIPFLATDIWAEAYKKIGFLYLNNIDGCVMLLPISVVEQSLNYGLELYGQKLKFGDYIKDFKQAILQTETFFSELIEQEKINKKQLQQSLEYLAKFPQYYILTEQYFTDKFYATYQSDEKYQDTILKLGELKNSTRLIGNKFILGESSYLGAIIKKLAKQFSVRHEDLWNFSAAELLGLFDEKRPDSEILKAREQAYVFEGKGKDYDVYIGQEAQQLIVNFYPVIDKSKIKEFNGTIANKGLIRGKVRIIIADYSTVNNLSTLMSAMESGEILVSETTSPDLMPALKKAAAIITNQGGVMSHAAIVSRELNIPCIVNTRIATKVLKDGDMVEVDAEKGIVKIIK